MNLSELIAALFYVQPSLIFTFVPVQIITLFLFLGIGKKSSLIKSFFHSLGATLFSMLVIMGMGMIIVPMVNVSSFRLMGLPFGVSLLVVVLSSLMYWLLIYSYLKYIVKIRDIAKMSALSSALAALSVILLYCLFWRL